MRIAVYPGSFDPLHIGHLAIMEYLTTDCEFDWVYLIVSPQSPLKGKDKILSAQKRYQDAIAAVKRHPELHVWVDDIELNMEPPHYTIRTLDELKLREPENDFTLVIGADNFHIFREWKDSDRILKEYGVVVFPREGFDSDKIKEKLMKESEDYKIEIIHTSLTTVSSTEIREDIRLGEDVTGLLM